MAFLGINVPELSGKFLNTIEVPGKKEDISEYHTTILYFKEDWEIQQAAKAMEATYEVVADFKPFLVKTSEITCFPKKEGEDCPIIAKVESDELHKLNEKLKKKFDKEDIFYSKTFKDYKPHITLAYSDKEIDKFKIDPVQFEVQEIVLWCGDYGNNRLFINFLLKGPEKKKESHFLLEKSNFFQKVASNLPQKITATHDRRKIKR